MTHVFCFNTCMSVVVCSFSSFVPVLSCVDAHLSTVVLPLCMRVCLSTVGVTLSNRFGGVCCSAPHWPHWYSDTCSPLLLSIGPVMMFALNGVVQGAGVVGGLAQEGMKKKIVDMALDSALHQADKVPKVAAFRTKAEARLARGKRVISGRMADLRRRFIRRGEVDELDLHAAARRL